MRPPNIASAADFAQGYLLGRPVPEAEVSLGVSPAVRCLDDRSPTTSPA